MKLLLSLLARYALMGFGPEISGHVESIGHGIGDSNDETGGLAQRVPVRIHIDTLPKGVELVAGLSASVAVGQ